LNEASPDGDRRHDPLEALRQPPFVFYTISRVLSAVGQSLLQAVLAWQVYDLTGSALDLGLLGLARFLPALASSLIGGAVADSYDRRKVMVLAKSVPLACVALLTAATFGGWARLELIFGVAMLSGFASAFEGPARQALLPAIVRPETFENAVTVSNTLQKLGSVSGPAVAGSLIAVAGLGWAYAFYCVVIVLSILPLFLLRNVRLAAGGRSVSIAAIKEGVQFVLHRQVLLGAMSLDMFAVIFGGAQALLPVYATDVLNAGPEGYGILYSSIQVGAFAMSAVMVMRPPVKRTGQTLVYSVIAFGLLTVAFGLSRNFYLSVLLYGLIGAADQVSVVMRQTTLQMATPDELRGRVSSVHSVFTGASSQIGAIESGFVAAITSATFAVVSGGAAAVAIAIAVAAKMPQLYNYEIGRGLPQDSRAPVAVGEERRSSA
jgi:MFS family permease